MLRGHVRASIWPETYRTSTSKIFFSDVFGSEVTFWGHNLKNFKKVFSLFLDSSCRDTPKNANKKNEKIKNARTYVLFWEAVANIRRSLVIFFRAAPRGVLVQPPLQRRQLERAVRKTRHLLSIN